MSESTAVVSIEEQIKQQLALQQQKMSQMSVGANLISFKGGQLIVDGLPVPGGEADVIVLGEPGRAQLLRGCVRPVEAASACLLLVRWRRTASRSARPAAHHVRGLSSE